MRFDKSVLYDAFALYDGLDLFPSQNLRFEVAFATDPDDPAPAWVDLSDRAHLPSGVTVRRGRADEFATVQAGALDIMLENIDGALSPDNPSSPFYPNVLPQRRCRLTYVDPGTGDALARFDGYVDRWPIAWPGGGQNYSRSAVTAHDLLARLGDRQKLRSVVVETLALDGPVVHFPLGEPADSTTVSSVDDGDPVTLGVQQVGTGGTVAFAEGTGVPTDGIAAPVFTPASSTDGVRLIGRGFQLNATPSRDVTLTTSLASKGTSGTAAGIFDDWGAVLSVDLDGSGRVVGRFAVPLLGVTITATSSAAYNNGQSTAAAVTLTASGGTTTLDLTVNGVPVASASTTAVGVPLFTGVTIGGRATSSLFTGTVSHVAVFPSKVSTSRLAEHYAAQMTGFAGERSDERLARVASWIGLPAERCAFDVGISTSIGHVDSTGLDPLTYMRKIEATEAGLLFAGTDGRLTFHNRARSYAGTPPALSIPVDLLGEDIAMAQDLQLVTNIVTGQRVGGATVRLVDAASLAAFGPLEDSFDVVTTSDDDVAAAVGWRLNTSSQPLTRFSDLSLDGFTDATYSPQIRQLVDIGARVEITGMPSQAPASTMRQTVQGYTETITDAQWQLSVNATPYDHLVAFVLDDPVLGALDSYPLAY